MGNMDSRGGFDGGYIYVKTDQPYYYPGGQVTGRIFIRADRELEGDKIEIKVKGKEKASFERDEQVDAGEGENGERRTQTIRVKEKLHQEILDYKATVWHFDGPLAPGDYFIGFSFTLPGNLPSTILMNKKHEHDKEKAHLQYSIKATLTKKGWFSNDMKYKQLLTIHEAPVEFKPEEYQVQTVSLTEWCCMAKGTCTLETKFNKNIFYANETAVADVRVDNSQCQLGVSCVEFQVTQKMAIKAHGQFSRGHTKTWDIIENKDTSGIPAGSQEKIVKQMTINMADIRFEPPPHRAKKNLPRSPEHMFMLSGLPPACHSRLIDNDYVLNCNVSFDGCTCCSSVPSISVPLTIIPLVHMETYGCAGPEGYEPQHLGNVDFAVNHHY